MFGIFPLLPAYGRDYKSRAAAQADFNAGKDFQTATGRYISRNEIIASVQAHGEIEVRSANKRRVFMLKL